MHARAVGVEDARHLDVDRVLAVVVEEQGFRAALAFVVAGTHADRIDIAPVAFGLRMLHRIAVDFTCGSLENAATQALGQAEHVDRAVHRGLGGLDRIVLVVDRRGRAGQVPDFVDFQEQRKSHVVAHEFEARMGVQMLDIALGAGEQIVHAQHFVVRILQQAIAQVRAQKTGAAGDQDAPSAVVVLHVVRSLCGYVPAGRNPPASGVESRPTGRKDSSV